MTKLRKPSKKQLEASSPGEVAQTFAEESNLQYIANLEMKNLQLAEQVQRLTQSLADTNVMLEHTKSLLVNSGQDNNVIMVMPSDEELIADLELKRLLAIAKERKLTLDEVKQYDLVTKNKIIARKNNEAVDIEGKRLPANTDEKTLMLIASAPLKLEGGK